MKILRSLELRSLEEEQNDNYGTGLTNANALSYLLSKNFDYDDFSLSSIFACVEIISNAIAEIPIFVKLREDNSRTILYDDPIMQSFDNSLIGRFRLIKMMVKDMLLTGNGLAYIQRDFKGQPEKIIYQKAGTYNINYDERNQTLYYTLLNLGKTVEPVNVIHLVKNSDNGVVGRDIFSYARNTINISKLTEKAVKDYWGSGCHVNGILTTDVTPLSKQKKQEIRQAWIEAHGPNGTGTAILEGGMRWENVSGNSKEAQMIETRLYNLQEICRFFSINPVLLGDLSKSSFSTVEACLLDFVTHTLYPYIVLIEEELNRKLILPNDKYKKYIDLDSNFILKSDKSTQANFISTLVKNGIMTINEGRMQLGLNPKDGCDDLIIPFTNINSNKVNQDNEDKESQPIDNQQDMKQQKNIEEENE